MDPWKYWNDVIKAPKLILAPMVDHSELPWRMMSREYGCQAAYTPMYHALQFASPKYRKKYFSTCPEDRPLFVQFCANNPDYLVEAARHVSDCCDGIDINLGCPQEIARRGHYGAFLQDEWNLISEMIIRLRNNMDAAKVAVSCKIRRFDETNKTIEYAKMLEKAGCTFLGLHGRTREQRGCRTGVADWNCIKLVKENIQIPVIANGNVQSLADANNCLDFTKADAVMTAEGNLYNPCLFMEIHPPAWIVAKKYLEYVDRYPVPANMAKSHIFKLFHRCVGLDENHDLRVKLGQSNTIEKIHEVVDAFQARYEVKGDLDQTVPIRFQPVPPYLCQPRYRYDAIENKTAIDDCHKANVENSHFNNEDECQIKRIRVS